MEPGNQPSFRDRPLNIDDSGKRRWIYVKQPKGKWYKRRTIFAWFCIAFLVSAPIIQVNGNPLMLLDIVNRKFSLFGNIILAQDNYIMALVMSVIVVSIVLFTVVFGRLWCGWACPQTIFLEMVYRRIEYLFDGNYRKGIKTQKKGISFILKRFGKHSAFILVSVIITNIFLMWFIGPEKLLSIITSPIHEHKSGFISMLAISLFYYWIYSYFREQVCTFACPYGRLQGVLLDSKSISVIYDFKRGEPRGAKAAGDCINCGQCIAVCPTGIDIKNGSQLECINCTACIDECNSVMEKLKRPLNLIRFDSFQGIETGKKNIFNGRVYAYSAVLVVLFAILIGAISIKPIMETSILRVPGTMYQTVDSATISNMYSIKIINRTKENKNLSFKILDERYCSVELAGKNNNLNGYSKLESILIVKMNKKALIGKSTFLKIGIFENEKLLEIEKINFIGPVN